MDAARECALVIGVGDRQGIGAAASVLFARQGLYVYMVGRTPGKLDPLIAEITAAGGQAEALLADCTQQADIASVFEQIANSGMALSLVVYNTGRNIPAPFLKSNVELLDDHFKRCTLGGFMVGQAALRLMLQRDESAVHRGSILYTGASASLRGKPLFAGFSAAKAGLRAMVQSMAREFGPRGIHIGHLVVDGIVNGAIVQGLDAGIGKLILGRKGEDGALLPDEVAKAFWQLHQQHPSAWTHELDLRPYSEGF